MAFRPHLAIAFLLLASGIAVAQGPPPFGGPGGREGPGSRGDLRGSSSGKWWANPMVVRRLNLTEEQQKRIEETFQQSRIKLIELSAELQKEEALLEPLLSAPHPVDSKVLPQIDRVADARSALEKANSRMLFGFRTILTLDQWTSLQSPGQVGLDRRPPGERPRGRN